jgi:hypothetical protein
MARGKTGLFASDSTQKELDISSRCLLLKFYWSE